MSGVGNKTCACDKAQMRRGRRVCYDKRSAAAWMNVKAIRSNKSGVGSTVLKMGMKHELEGNG